MNTHIDTNDLIDFETLRTLAIEDPQKLENWRRTQIESIIERAPLHMQRRLRGLQFQIDCERTLHKTPLGACIAISKRMHESLQTLTQAILNRDEQPAKAPQSADVLRFPC